MMQVVPKWRVTIARPSTAPLVLFISDQFLSNVLRKLADIELEQQPNEVTIALVLIDGPQARAGHGGLHAEGR